MAEDEGKEESLAVKESGDVKASLLLLDAEGGVKIDVDIEMKERGMVEEDLRVQLLATKVEAEKAERAKLRGEAGDPTDSTPMPGDPLAVKTPTTEGVTLRYQYAKSRLSVELKSKRHEAHSMGLTQQEKRFRNKSRKAGKLSLAHLQELGRSSAKKDNGNTVAQAQRVEKAQLEQDEMAKLEQQAARLRVETIEFKQKHDEARAKSEKERESKFQKEVDERRRF